MPQGSKRDENGKVIWPLHICIEFDCNEEHAANYGVKCGGDFTKKPCMFLREHEELNEVCAHDWGDNVFKDGETFRFGCMLYKCRKCGTRSNTKE